MRNALVVQGAIGFAYDRRQGVTCSDVTEGFCDYEICGKAINKFIVNNNKNVDVFIQCWTLFLKDKLIDLYNPVRHSFVDDRTLQEEFDQTMAKCPSCDKRSEISRSKSWEISVKMVNEYAAENNIVYDRVMVCRPDIYYRRPVNLDTYDVSSTVYTNNPWFGEALPPIHGNLSRGGGDLHWIMSYETYKKMEHMYASISPTFVPDWHWTVERYVVNILNLRTEMDSFNAGVDHLAGVDCMRISKNCVEHL